MRTVLLHGLGQTAKDWEDVVSRIPAGEVDCPELFAEMTGEVSYSRLLADLEHRYAGTAEPLRLCGLSLGALLAMDYTIRHPDEVASLVLIATQYKAPRLLIDCQNLLFRCMPGRSFSGMGISKSDAIALARSMRSLDFTARLGEIVCPVVILCGERDRVNLRASRRLQELLPDATLHVVPGAGHELNRAAPDAIADALDPGTPGAPTGLLG
ncbi:Alpha/beta hydrolase fold-1 [Propionibacterium ruminifibrarum]|uniref:Alpha/beta hydrolase fold-1 n=1 Tax=Propionibacterium ruminifibrarum TaxID=1962131 RepID=A0A375I364_9ACTN|nr:alpha/beta hydrolase [Propionibacterium ruminifibrarum]SPF69138.1 Alpha/beta hydrolase fold-1 [Propionibacterium ruminifibrarum]